MDYLGLTKQVVGLVVSFGVGTIVKNAVEHTTPNTVKTLSKVCISVAGLFASMMISDVVSKFSEKKIDEVAEKFKIEGKTE